MKYLLPDSIYERSVIKQLHLQAGRERQFTDHNGGTSVIKAGGAGGYRATVSRCLFFTEGEENVLDGWTVSDIERELLCRGAALTELRAEIIAGDSFTESDLRTFTHSLEISGQKYGALISDVTVFDGRMAETRIVITGTGDMRNPVRAPWQAASIYPGQEVILTGMAGRSAMVKLFRDREHEIRDNFTPLFCQRTEKFLYDRLPMVEMNILQYFFASAVVPAGQGGVEAAFMRLGDRKKAGLSLDISKIHFDQETLELAEYFNLNPMQMESYGCYIIAMEAAEDAVISLRRAGIPATVVGTVTKEKKRVIQCDDEIRFMELAK